MPADPAVLDDLIAPETYCLGLLASEMGEATQVIGNALRFGLHTPERGGADAVSRLQDELGDVLAAMRFAIDHGVVDYWAIEERASAKSRKLHDPDQRDNLGRRLAPEPPTRAALRQGADHAR